MGIDTDFGMSFAKSQIAAGNPLPESGRVFLSVKDKDKAGLLEVAQGLAQMDSRLLQREAQLNI